MTDDSIYRHSGPYWLYTDSAGADAGGGDDDQLMKTIRTLVGTIIMFIIGLMICSLLPSCSSTRRATETETCAAQKTEETHRTSETADSTATSRATLDRQETGETSEKADEWYSEHIEKTTWSEPDSLGRQHKISTETWDRSGGTSKTRQDKNTSSQAAVLADSTSLSRGQTSRTRTTSDSVTRTAEKTTEKTTGAAATAAGSVGETIAWALAAAALCAVIWKFRRQISSWIWRMILKLVL